MIGNKFLPVLLLLAYFNTISRAADELSYIGAVVEFSPQTSPRPQNLDENVKRYIDFIREAKQELADIIVFPEIGLNGYGLCTPEMYTVVSHPSEKTAPCDHSSQNNMGFNKALIDISCAARDNKIYVVINVAEKFNNSCPLCNEEIHYNTNVVLDADGVIIARYRKYNLFGEFGTSVTDEPEIAFFDTTFGVRFGTFICFDLMFDRPALQLVKQLGITDFVYSTAWFSEMPFLTALQAQQSWSYSLDVNFLASGYNDPEKGSGGSGIHLGRNGLANFTMADNQTSALLIAKVPRKLPYRINNELNWSPAKKQTTSAADLLESVLRDGSNDYGMFLKRDDIDLYESSIIDMTADSSLESKFQLCYDEFCCDFLVTAKPVDASNTMLHTYRAIVFDGVRTFDGFATGGVRACAIVACTNSSLDSCAYRFNSEAGNLLTSISITMPYNGSRHDMSLLVMPNTLLHTDTGLHPMSTDFFKFESGSSNYSITLNTHDPSGFLLTFGMWSRVFDRDGMPKTSGQNPLLAINSLFLTSIITLFSYLLL